MNPTIRKMLERYPGEDRLSREQALREIIQEIAVVGLWRAQFFQHAAFYGGTALRILYGLDRFSEDLDFTLLKSDSTFSWNPYGKQLVEELNSYGFAVSLTEKEKKIESPIRSAFLKTNTRQELLKVGVSDGQLRGVHPETLIRIKIEVDTDPPLIYETEQRYLSDPFPAPITTVKKDGLFASKMYTALFRTWKNRVKGRDWYDVVWFIRSGVPLSLPLFCACSKEFSSLTPEEFIKLAHDQIERLDLKAAADDVRPFLRDTSQLDLWSKAFFHHWFQQITFV